MDIIFYYASVDADSWIQGLLKRLPDARIRQWQPGDDEHADYAMVRLPPLEMLKGRTALKAVFSLSAGVDDILAKFRENPEMLPDSVPLFRLEDAGMGRQMKEYAVHAVLGWYRRFDEYREQKEARLWNDLPVPPKENFTVGLLGPGVLGQQVLEGLKEWGFPLRSWSRSPKSIDGVTSFHGDSQLHAFLAGTQVLINLLPDTPATRGIINRALLRRLNPGAYVLNLGRGVQVVEEDLLAALDAGEVRAAALDVFVTEPLPKEHPFWTHPRIAITPHSAAYTLPDESFDAIAKAVHTLESGGTPGGLVDRARGY